MDWLNAIINDLKTKGEIVVNTDDPFYLCEYLYEEYGIKTIYEPTFQALPDPDPIQDDGRVIFMLIKIEKRTNHQSEPWVSIPIMYP